MTTTTNGIPATALDDATLDRELAHLHETRHEAVLHASADALDVHTHRMLEMEGEYLRRFPAGPDPRRTRAGSRARAGQDGVTPATG